MLQEGTGRGKMPQKIAQKLLRIVKILLEFSPLYGMISARLNSAQKNPPKKIAMKTHNIVRATLVALSLVIFASPSFARGGSSGGHVGHSKVHKVKTQSGKTAHIGAPWQGTGH